MSWQQLRKNTGQECRVDIHTCPSFKVGVRIKQEDIAERRRSFTLKDDLAVRTVGYKAFVNLSPPSLSMLACHRLRTHVRLDLFMVGVRYVNHYDIPIVFDGTETIFAMQELS